MLKYRVFIGFLCACLCNQSYVLLFKNNVVKVVIFKLNGNFKSRKLQQTHKKYKARIKTHHQANPSSSFL